jgi:hypothetical protein
VLYKECPAETFVHSDKPAELLGQYHAFLLDASVSDIPALQTSTHTTRTTSIHLDTEGGCTQARGR